MTGRVVGSDGPTLDATADGDSCPECGHASAEHADPAGCAHAGCACKLWACPDPLPCPLCASPAWISPIDEDAVACANIECALGFMNPPHMTRAAWNQRAPCARCKQEREAGWEEGYAARAAMEDE